MKQFIRWAPGALFLLLVFSGCGNDPGTKVTPTVVNADGSPGVIVAAAYQVEDGSWQPLNPDADGGISFYVPKGKARYGVAVRCAGMFLMANYSFNTVAQLTTAESTAPRLTCMTAGPYARIKGNVNVSGVTGAAKYQTYSWISNYERNATSGEYRLSAGYGTGRDMVVFATDASDAGLAGKIVRGIDARAPVTVPDLSLTNADALLNYNIGAFSVPSGWSGDYSLNLYSAGGTVVTSNVLGEGTHAGGAVHVLADAQAGDTYMLSISASGGTGTGSIARMRYVDAPDMGDISESLHIQPFAGYSVTAAVRPVFPANHPGDVLAYVFMVLSDINLWTYTVSTAWLDGAATYATPDLSGLRGFKHNYALSGEGIGWFTFAFVANVSAQEFFELPSVPLYFFSLPKKKGLVLDIASANGSFLAP